MGLDAERLTVRAGRGYGKVKFARFLSKNASGKASAGLMLS